MTENFSPFDISCEIDLTKELEFAQQLAKEVGERALLMQKNLQSIVVKGPKDLVTEADLATDAAIREAIQTRFPDHGLITEENDNLNMESPYHWHIDPIDGTVNFASGLPLWGVSIGLEYKNKLALGVVYFPALKELFYGSAATGAFCNQQKIIVKPNSDLASSIVINNGMNIGATLEDQASFNKKWIEILEKLAPRTSRSPIFGAAVYETALVARGSVEGYICRGYKSWDLAAMACIAAAAGACITSLDGSAFKLTDLGQGALITNGLIHGELVSILP